MSCADKVCGELGFARSESARVRHAETSKASPASPIAALGAIPLGTRLHRRKSVRRRTSAQPAGPRWWPVLLSSWEWERHWAPMHPTACPICATRYLVATPWGRTTERDRRAAPVPGDLGHRDGNFALRGDRQGPGLLPGVDSRAPAGPAVVLTGRGSAAFAAMLVCDQCAEPLKGGRRPGDGIARSRLDQSISARRSLISRYTRAVQPARRAASTLSSPSSTNRIRAGRTPSNWVTCR